MGVLVCEMRDASFANFEIFHLKSVILCLRAENVARWGQQPEIFELDLKIGSYDFPQTRGA